MAGQHADPGHAVGRHERAAWHRRAERQAAGVADHAIAVEGTDRVAGEERVHPLLGGLRRGAGDGEGGGEHDMTGVGVGVAQGAYLDRHGRESVRWPGRVRGTFPRSVGSADRRGMVISRHAVGCTRLTEG
jgi:hypothetical protein